METTEPGSSQWCQCQHRQQQAQMETQEAPSKHKENVPLVSVAEAPSLETFKLQGDPALSNRLERTLP